MPNSDDRTQPRRVSIQISREASIRLDTASKQVDLTRPRIIEHLIMRLPLRDLVRLLKTEAPSPTRLGRPKQSVFDKAT